MHNDHPLFAYLLRIDAHMEPMMPGTGGHQGLCMQVLDTMWHGPSITFIKDRLIEALHGLTCHHLIISVSFVMSAG